MNNTNQWHLNFSYRIINFSSLSLMNNSKSVHLINLLNLYPCQWPTNYQYENNTALVCRKWILISHRSIWIPVINIIINFSSLSLMNNSKSMHFINLLNDFTYVNDLQTINMKTTPLYNVSFNINNTHLNSSHRIINFRSLSSMNN